jgi:hypothetical protein
VEAFEAFEAFVALALEDEKFVVSESVKFPVSRQTSKSAYAETQTHGFEVDLVAARADKLVLATVKSFFGSRGVVWQHVLGESTKSADNSGYALLNDQLIRDAVVEGACKRYGYTRDQVQLRIYVGKFADKGGKHEARIREWCDKERVGSGPIKVFNVVEVAEAARRVAARKAYRDNPALVAIKVLDAANMLVGQVP